MPLSTNTQLQIEILAVLGGSVLLITGAVVLTLKSMRRNHSDQWQTLINRATSRAAAAFPDLGPLVNLTFHTYSGFLHHFTQKKHELRLPLRAALEVLADLNKYNLTRSLVPYPGSLFVPILSWLNYRRERSALLRQANQITGRDQAIS